MATAAPARRSVPDDAWTPEEHAAALTFIAHRRELLQKRTAVTMEVRLKAGEIDQWFAIYKDRLSNPYPT